MRIRISEIESLFERLFCVSFFSNLSIDFVIDGPRFRNFIFWKYWCHGPRANERRTFMFAIFRTSQCSMVECSPIFNCLRFRNSNIMFLNSLVKFVFVFSNAEHKRKLENWTKILNLDQYFQYRKDSGVYFGTPFIHIFCERSPHITCSFSSKCKYWFHFSYLTFSCINLGRKTGDTKTVWTFLQCKIYRD